MELSKRVLYIAGPMSGIEDLNYPAFAQAEDQLMEAGFKTLNPIDSAKRLPLGIHLPWEWYMRQALKMVCEADGIALLNGWMSSPGARLEVDVAQRLAIPCMEVTEWVNAMSEVA